MKDLANRLRAAGVSENRLYSIGLARRAPDLPDRATDDELALAHEYNELKKSQPFEAAKLRERNALAVDRGSKSLRAIDQWLDDKQIAAKHHFEAEK
jgi:hypothetical protein